jgi:hypothetical protein
MVLDMLYRHEKNEFSKRKQTSLEPILDTAKLHIVLSPLDGLRVQFKMYSWLCPWLLTWSDYEEDYTEGDDGFNNAGAN